MGSEMCIRDRDMVYNSASATVVILDNRITAMTGRQENPSSGYTLMGADSYRVDLEQLCRAVGVRHVQVVDPYQVAATRQVLKEEMERPEVSVVIARRACMLVKRDPVARKPAMTVASERCNGCRACLKLGCPAIEWRTTAAGKGVAHINPLFCVGCGLCNQVCSVDAIGDIHE